MQLMGILNTTPDSFYDGGKYTTLDNAIKRAEDILKEGASIIDIGGASSRPGASEVPQEEEFKRTIPVIRELKKRFPEAIYSIDTTNFDTALAAADEGVQIINDVSALADPKLAGLAAAYNIKLVIMHTRGTPQTMQENCQYDNLLTDIFDFFREKIEIAKAQNLPKTNIILDIGLGFAKTREQNWQLLENLDFFKALDLPLLVGASRKSFTDYSLELSLKAARLAWKAKADYLRVHDVKETADFLKVLENEK